MEDEAGQEIPAGRRHIIERPRLTRLLDETSAKVIMLVAPAGYGKTTLARQWLADKPHAWYQGGASSADVAGLALGIAEASEPVVSDVGRRLREWLPTSRQPEQEVDIIAQFLREDLVGWQDDAWFAIDDYHLLASKASEKLIRRLFVSGGLRVLLTSRQRPAWSSARELLYGNFFELGQSSLAMNMEEANAVMVSRNREAASGLVALADGWPAVIGLAALAPNPIQLEGSFPEELHDYFAEELFASLPAETQNGLRRLALIPVVSHNAAAALLGSGAEGVIEQAKEAGMLAAQRPRDFSMHPLLRAFLLNKLVQGPPADLADAVTRAAEYCLEFEAWDDLFALITQFDRIDLMDELLRHALVHLTRVGRLTTLREWLDFARRAGLASPYVDLTDAELAFRLGRHERGGTLASAAASSFEPEDPFLSSAHYRAGQSRHLMDDSAGALHHFDAALASAHTETDVQNALWGRFTVAFEQERSEAFELLAELEVSGTKDRDSTVRIECGRLMLALLEGGSIPPVSELRELPELAADASDPLVRSALLRALAAVLVLGAQYQDALNAGAQALEEAEHFHLGFVRPHTLVSRAAACIGLRRFADASESLREIEGAAKRMRDPYLVANVDILRCRLLLNEGSPQAALEAVSGDWSRGPTPAREMEFGATKAAALACAGRPKEALAELAQLEQLSRALEPQLLHRWARAICLLFLKHDKADREVVAAFNQTSSSHAYDTFVFASRLHSRILEVLAEDRQRHEALARILERSNDHQRAIALGLPVGRESVGDPPLTKREHEVYTLLAEGRSNREIAHALFISEPTVKVHVRNVLRKTGARTRVEAAIQAVTKRQLQALAAEDQSRHQLDSDPQG
ncbi:MAG TPA: LuxR C-terminal-related transcriptional regulator [Gaiellaceae bacterium]|nr:LuxR C-terminal-related transcriptional regulator [Gaiellaceae bacterium]